jgi:hypothetical protein
VVHAQSPHNRSAVVDIGAGSFGAVKLELLKKCAAYSDVYVHAMIPCVDEADPARIESIKEKFICWNPVSATHQPLKGRLNWCNHTAATCTCLKHYTHVQLISTHSAYYMTDADYENVLSYGNHVTALVHLREGPTLPIQSPEFNWLDAKDEGSYFSRAKRHLKELLTGDREVIMRPVAPGGTSYTHVDLTPTIKRGGYHVGPWTPVMHKYGEPVAACKAAAIGATVAATTAFLACPGPIPVKAAQAAVAAAASVGATLATIRTAHELSRWTDPPPGATHTVRMSVVNSLVDEKTKEPIASIIHIQRRSPRSLTASTLSDTPTDPDQLGRAMNGVLLGGDNEKSERQIHANMAREGVPAYLAKNTVHHAKRLVSFLCNRNHDARQPIASLQPVLGFVCLPFAWALSKYTSSTLTAALNTCESSIIVTVCRSMSTHNLWPVLPLVLLWPTLTLTITITGLLVGLVVSE